MMIRASMFLLVALALSTVNAQEPKDMCHDFVDDMVLSLAVATEACADLMEKTEMDRDVVECVEDIVNAGAEVELVDEDDQLDSEAIQQYWKDTFGIEHEGIGQCIDEDNSVSDGLSEELITCFENICDSL